MAISGYLDCSVIVSEGYLQEDYGIPCAYGHCENRLDQMSKESDPPQHGFIMFIEISRTSQGKVI